MSILNLRPVSRDMVKLVVGLAGVSGDGKSRSALELAYGLSDFNPSKIVLLDTENRRGSLYCDIFKGRKGLKGDHRFMIADLFPPFSPDRYIEAMREIAEAAPEVVVIDSVSHEHEGEGGLEEIAHRPKSNGEPRKIPDWITAKRAHKRFVNTLLFLPMHVICCIRAREKTDFKNPNEPRSLGIQPICEKNFLFEMTFSFLLKNRGKSRDVLKLNDDFAPLVGTDGYITPDHGKALRDWLGDADPLERSRATLRLAASMGTDALKTAWTYVPANQKKALEPFKDTLKDLAAHADHEALVPPTSSEPNDNEPY